MLRRAVVCRSTLAVALFFGAADGAEINVDCSNPKARIKTTTAALALLNKKVENTIRVSGACTDWVRIDFFENLNIIANAGASINAPTTPAPDQPMTVWIHDQWRRVRATRLDVPESRITALLGATQSRECMWDCWARQMPPSISMTTQFRTIEMLASPPALNPWYG
jgi:hypothetical protein